MGAQWHIVNIDENTPNVIIDGFEIWGAGISGIKSYSDNTTIRNCWIHNNSLAGIEIHGRNNAVIENNLVEFNGMNPQFHHGIYLDGTGHVIRGNVIRHNAGFGLHLYPKIENTSVVNNLIYGHASHGGVLLSCAADKGGLSFVNNTVADNVIGMAIYSCQGVSIQNNIFANDKSIFQLMNNPKNLLIDYNLYSGPSQSYGSHDLQGNPRFINPYKGIYWIDEKSAAIGHGNPDIAPVNDLMGWERPKNNSPDIGAYQYRKLPDSKDIVERYQYRTNTAADTENFIFWKSRDGLSEEGKPSFRD
jgi:parallel beta-helix repeat protein